MTNDERKLEIERCLHRIMEVADCVQVLASYTDSEGTHSCFVGAGNWFARTGMARDFLERDSSHTSANEIKPFLQPPPEDGENWKR